MRKKGGKLILLTKEMTRPNGIELSPDEKTLYLANSDPDVPVWMSFPIKGDGTIGKIKRQGNAITFGVNLTAKGGGAYQYIYVVSYPLVTGATWSNFYTTDGKTLSQQFTRTYTVTGAARHGTRGLRSSTDRPH